MSHGLWWQIGSELGSNCTAVTVWAGDFSPDDSSCCGSFAARSCCPVLAFVDEGYPLSHVESGIFLAVGSLNLEQSSTFMLVAESTFVPGENGFSSQSYHFNCKK